MNYETIRSNPKQFTALCGLSVAEFDSLLDLFAPLVEKRLQTHNIEGKRRKHKYDPSKLNFLKTPEIQLLFILSYLKHNPTQVYHATSFGMAQDWACRWIHFLMPILEEALAPFAPDPNPKPKSITDETILIDATERPVQRSTYDQEEYYSGKKKAYR